MVSAAVSPTCRKFYTFFFFTKASICVNFMLVDSHTELNPESLLQNDMNMNIS